jgi:PhnB protein
MPVAAEDADKVMHVSLPLGEGQVLMGSDQPAERGGVSVGNTVAISTGPDPAEDGRRIFEGLAQGGTVVVPYERQFWGADYGMCIDRFGIGWMVNYEHHEG